ncbi:MAG TPA: hypothetical protein VHQ00_11295 [Chloroflexota bacterium]|nr:hypothetical protein [Chloroflexota bacterium]
MESNETAAGGAGGAGGAPGTAASPPEETAIGHDWARRRLDLYGEVERALREGIAGALQTAATIRADVERDAEAYLGRLAGERERLSAELSDLDSRRQAAEAALIERQQEIDASLSARLQKGEAEIARLRSAAEEEVAALRQKAGEEVAALRREAEEETAALRSRTQSEIDTMVQEAEQRRAQVAAEVRALEEQVAQIQGVIDSFLDNQLQTLRGSLGVAGQGVAGQGVAGQGPAGGTTGAPRRPAPRGAGAQSQSGSAPAEGWPPQGGAPGAGGAPSAGAGPEDDSAPPPEGTERTAVVITGVPHFSRARALWQAIQEVPGVSEAKAINYQGGVLALEVQHDPALDLSGSVTDLPGLRLRVSETAPGELRLAADA